MFPLYDQNPSKTKPFVNWALIAINIVVFVWEYQVTRGFSDETAFDQILGKYAVIPQIIIPSLRSLRFENLGPLFSSMFLHAGFAHIFGNLVFLFIFGDNIEDRFGHSKYLIVYLIFGVVGGVVHSYISYAGDGTEAFIPALGASGAISGVLGSYIVLFPTARIVTIAFFGFIFRLLRIPAFFYLGFWFLLQFLYVAVGSVGGVAFWAHIGGFVAGFLAGLVYRAIFAPKS